MRKVFYCESDTCAFEFRPDPTRAMPSLNRHSGLAKEAATSTAAMLTASAFGPMNAWSFVSPSDCGLGLYARVELHPGQWIAEYSGPRLPENHIKKNEYCLQIPGSRWVIDGASENSPMAVPPSTAIFANHSSQPNAHLETWPVPRPTPGEVRQHMMMVALETIPAGGMRLVAKPAHTCSALLTVNPRVVCVLDLRLLNPFEPLAAGEIRIDYDKGASYSPLQPGTLYWPSGSPPETSWQSTRLTVPPPTAEEPLMDRLADLQMAAAAGHRAPPCPDQCIGEPIPWEGAGGGDSRLKAVVPMLRPRAASRPNQTEIVISWAAVSTHVPGRTGKECRDRWTLLHEK